MGRSMRVRACTWRGRWKGNIHPYCIEAKEGIYQSFTFITEVLLIVLNGLGSSGTTSNDLDQREPWRIMKHGEIYVFIVFLLIYQIRLMRVALLALSLICWEGLWVRRNMVTQLRIIPQLVWCNDDDIFYIDIQTNTVFHGLALFLRKKVLNDHQGAISVLANIKLVAVTVEFILKISQLCCTHSLN